jgi:hypothetical protein
MIHTHTDKIPDNKRQSVANSVAQKKNSIEFSAPFVDQRPAAILQQKLQAIADYGTRAKQPSLFTSIAETPAIQRKGGNKKKINEEEKQPLIDSSGNTSEEISEEGSVSLDEYEQRDKKPSLVDLSEERSEEGSVSLDESEQGKDKSLIWEDLHEDSSEKDRMEQLKSNEAFMKGVFKDQDIPYQEGDEIPKIIHRFWSGGPMSEATMKVLRESAGKTQGTGWQNRFWFSKTLEKHFEVDKAAKKKRKEQRKELKKLGYEVQSIEDLAKQIEKATGRNTGPKITKAGINEMGESAAGMANDKSNRKRYEGIKHLSDIARLMYGYQYGGHHFDTDMGLGNMDLTKAYHHNDKLSQVPLMGAVAATSDNYVRAVKADPGALDTRKNKDQATAKRLINQVPPSSRFLNGMFATAPKNKNILSALDAMTDEYSKKDGIRHFQGTFLSEMMVSGKEAASKKELNMTIPPYLLDIEPITPESDNR